MRHRPFRRERGPGRPSRGAVRRGAALGGTLAALACARADASFLSGDALDTAADVLSWIILVIVPLIGIALFWIVHVLPEKIAYKRHHPQAPAIHTLCLLSLVFGGMLWPFAWLWAYTKPVFYRGAYGTDRADEYYLEMGRKARAGELSDDELAHLGDDLDRMRAQGALSAPLRELHEDVRNARASPAAPSIAAAPSLASTASIASAAPEASPAPGASAAASTRIRSA